MGFFNQLRLLLWKNFTLRKRQKLRLIAEISFPLALFMILVIVRTTRDLRVPHPECHFDGKALPSAGVLPFLQTYACTYNNTCYQTVTPDERPDTLGNFNQSVLSELVTDLEEILMNRVDVELISDLFEDINLMADIWPRLRDGNTTGNVTLGGDNIINPTELRDRILSQNLLTSDVVDWLVNATLNRRLLTEGANETSLLDVIGTFVPPNYASMTTQEQAQFIRTEICDKQRLDEIFWFPNATVADNVHRELCNLSTDQLIELGNDFANLFNWIEFVESVARFVQDNTGDGRVLNNGDSARINRTLEMTRQLWNDIQNSDSWQKAFRDLQATFQQMQDQGIGNASAAGSEALNGMSRLVCGRGNSFLAIGTEQRSTQNSRTPVNPNLNTETTTGPPTELGGTSNCENMSLTSECKAIFDSFQASEMTRIMWRQLKPFVLGMILYYPQNNVTEQLVKDAGQVFVDIQTIVNMSSDWQNTSAELTDALNNSRVANFVRNLVDNPLCDIVEHQITRQFSALGIAGLNYNGSICDNMARFLDNGPDTEAYDWRDALQNLDGFFDAINTYGKCFNFNKFCGYTDHEAFIKDGLMMIEQEMFWAGIEFEFDIDKTGGTLPKHVSYSIRMDTDKVDSTKRVKDKYFRYAPRRNPGIDTKYFTFGFAYIQDMIEHAILKAHTGLGSARDAVGIFTQQFPYFCYTEDR